MSVLLWPLVALVGLALAYRVAMADVQRRMDVEREVDALSRELAKQDVKRQQAIAHAINEHVAPLKAELDALKLRVVEVDQRTNPSLISRARR